VVRLFSSDIHDQMPCRAMMSNSGRSCRAASSAKLSSRSFTPEPDALATARACATCVELKSVPQNSPGTAAAWMLRDKPWAVRELKIAQGLCAGRGDPGAQASQAQYAGAKLTVIAVGILDPSDVARRPVHRSSAGSEAIAAVPSACRAAMICHCSAATYTVGAHE